MSGFKVFRLALPTWLVSLRARFLTTRTDTDRSTPSAAPAVLPPSATSCSPASAVPAVSARGVRLLPTAAPTRVARSRPRPRLAKSPCPSGESRGGGCPVAVGRPARPDLERDGQERMRLRQDRAAARRATRPRARLANGREANPTTQRPKSPAVASAHPPSTTTAPRPNDGTTT